MTILCQQCGEPMTRGRTEGRQTFAKRRFCSHSCAHPRLTPTEILSRHSRRLESGCIEWIGSKNSDGYGTTSVKEYRGAHRLAYFIANGPIPAGTHVLHRCDNPACVAPDHLFLGDHAANMADMVAKNRQNRHAGEANGRAKLTADQVREALLSPLSGAALGRRWGVQREAINAIRRGAKWQHL